MLVSPLYSSSQVKVPFFVGSTAKLSLCFTFDEPNEEFIITLMPKHNFFQLVRDLLYTGLREFLCSLSHVFCRELIYSQQLEAIDVEVDNSSELEVRFDQVPIFFIAPMLLSFQEFSSNDSRVLIRLLVHLNSVIPAEEINDKFAVIIILCFGDQSCLKSQNILILSEHFDNILFGWFRLESIYTTQTVLQCSVAIIRWDLVNDPSVQIAIDLDWSLCHTIHILEKFLRELVAVIDHAFSPKDNHCTTNYKVLRIIELFLFEAHAWIVSVYWDLWELLSAKEKRERIPSRVLLPNFLHFDGVISQEVIDYEQVGSSFECTVLPQCAEREHFPIVIEILGQAPIGMPSAQFNLDILLVLLGVGRIDLQILLLLVLLESIVRLLLRVIELHIHVVVELLGEFVAVVDVEDPFKEVNVHPDLEVLPLEVIVQKPDALWDFLPLDEDTLRYA